MNAYNKATRELGRPPKSFEELKPRLQTYGDVDKLLISPNDGQPLVIVYGADLYTEPTPDNPQIIAYEKTGKDGIRYTIDPRGTINKYDAARFSRLRFAGGHKPDTGG